MASDLTDIEDFTNASSWERLIASIEAQLRTWGLHDGGNGYLSELLASPSSPSVPLSPRCHVTSFDLPACGGRTYALHYFYLPDPADLPKSVYHGDLIQLATSSLVRRVHHNCTEHPLTKWFGVFRFVIIAPTTWSRVLTSTRRSASSVPPPRSSSSSSSASSLSRSEASFLLSSLVLAATHAHCSTPCFAPVGSVDEVLFLGHMVQSPGASCLRTVFDVQVVPLNVLPDETLTALDPASTAVSHPTSNHTVLLDGIKRFFRALFHVPRAENVMIHMSYTYVHEAILWDDVGRYDERHGAVWRSAEEDEEVLSGAFWGPSTDPVSAFRLRLSWPFFRQDVFVENHVHSEIDFAAASWTLAVDWAPASSWLDTPLTDAVRRLLGICEASCALPTLHRVTSPQNASPAPAASAPPTLYRPAKRQLRSPSESPAPSDDEELVSSHDARAPVPSVDPAPSLTSRTISKILASTAAGRVPKVDFFDEAMQAILPNELPSDTPPPPSPLTDTPAPFGSILSVLVSWLLRASYDNALSLRTVAIMWETFTHELRHAWKHGIPLPQLLSPDDPDLRFCVLHQKLQLLQRCIHIRNRDPDEEQAPDIAETLANTTLLDGESPFHVPSTQNMPTLTEDEVLEQQRVFEELGTSEEAQLQRAELQSAGMLSDMQAFKAVNPNAVFEDFVRWHSPNDWLGDHLSVRMASPNNTWQRLWARAEPVPVSRQPPLFDAHVQGEKILDFLENIAPVDLFQQLCWIALFNSYSVLVSFVERADLAATAAAQQALAAQLNRIAFKHPQLYDASRKPNAHVFAGMLDVCDALKTAETVVARAESLLHTFPSSAALVNALLNDSSHFNVAVEERDVVCQLFNNGDSDGRPTLPQHPSTKQYTVVHATEHMPSEWDEDEQDDDLVVAQRMYMRVEDGQVRLATASTQPL